MSYTDTQYGKLESRYAQLHTAIAELHASKNADYGEIGIDPYANFRKASRAGVSPWRGAVVRMFDKVSRIETYCTQGELENETVRDSFLDLANYALIACALWEEQQAQRQTALGMSIPHSISTHPAATSFQEQWTAKAQAAVAESKF